MKEFKAESKRLLDLMINSIYTNKEIFLRELISNASDAIDKRQFMSLTDSSLAAEFKIEIEIDKANRILKINDNGCGMSAESLENNLGTIAKSGTLDFKTTNKTDESLIGQFGVGFYSSFMVADKVIVISRAIGEDMGNKWESTGADGYTIEPCAREGIGSTVILHLKDKDEDCDYDEYLEDYTIENMVVKYSDYIRFPIIHGEKTLNSMVPIWKKPKAQVTAEDYNAFYKDKFFDYQDPIKVLNANLEGNLNYSTLLFVPQKAPFDYYSKDYAKGLKLYSGGVLIMEKCADLLPDCFGFVRGLVDSADLSLNISRELLQKNRQLRAIAVSLEKKLISEFKKMITSDRETYDKMFAEFGNSIKMGAYDNYGAKKDDLKDLLEFKSSAGESYTTFKEYLSRIKEGQEFIYYGCGESAAKISALPSAEKLLASGKEILYLTENIDEFVIKVIEAYEGKKFKSVADKDASVVTDDEKQEVAQKSDDNKALLEEMKTLLGGKVKEVRLTAKLQSSAASVSSDSEISLEMERILTAMPGNKAIKADRVLEVNPKHAVFAVLQDLFSAKSAKLGDYTNLLYSTALMQEGLEVSDTLELSKQIINLLQGETK